MMTFQRVKYSGWNKKIGASLDLGASQINRDFIEPKDSRALDTGVGNDMQVSPVL